MKDNRTTAILLIEDNPGHARLIQEMLAESRAIRFELAVADRLSTGLERLALGGIDAILLDLSLPDSHGLDTLDRLLATDSGVPVIVLTGLDDDVVGLKAVSNGAQDYLVKGQVEDDQLVRTVRYVSERQRAEGERWRLAVTDTGHGIALDNMDKVFEPLFTTKARGIGLGLALSQNLARANRGTIEVESVAGQGSTFTVSLSIKAMVS